MTKEAKQELRELWAERIEPFLSSGLSQRAWCTYQSLILPLIGRECDRGSSIYLDWAGNWRIVSHPWLGPA